MYYVSVTDVTHDQPANGLEGRHYCICSNEWEVDVKWHHGRNLQSTTSYQRSDL